MPDRRYSRTPDTIALLVACALAGAVIAVTRTVPPSVDGLVSWWAGMVWAILLTAAATASLVGLLHRNVLTGWALEATGRSLLAGTMAAYCFALIVAATGWGSALPILITGAIAIASAWRVRQVMSKLAQVREAVRRADEG